LIFQFHKNELRELHEHFGSSVNRDLARALSPHSRGCGSNVHDPCPFILVPLAACGKAHLKCRLTERHISAALLCVFGLVSFG